MGEKELNQQMSLFDGKELEFIVGCWTFKTFYDERRKKWRLILNDKETLYTDKNVMMEWDMETEAVNYLLAIYPSGWLKVVEDG
jgi:hypothetical protein